MLIKQKFQPKIIVKRFVSSNEYKKYERKLINEKKINNKIIFSNSISEVFDVLDIKDRMTISFNHYLGNGDYVQNIVNEEILKRDIKGLYYAPNSIFSNNTILSTLIENKNVTNIETTFLNGKVADTIGEGKLDGLLIINTIGGRSRKIESGEMPIDVAFITLPAFYKEGNTDNCLEYAISDLKYAHKVVLVTDCKSSALSKIELINKYVDVILEVDKVGEQVNNLLESTTDKEDLEIASLTSELLNELGLIKNNMSMQIETNKKTLAVINNIRDIMEQNNIKSSFVIGEKNNIFMDMQKKGLLEKFYDIKNLNSSKYVNPYDEPICDKLDFVVLNANEIDKDFNVNVITDFNGKIIGGSNVHSDIAHGAKVTVVITKLNEAKTSIIKNKVTTITTPGEDIDILVTEKGISINPKRNDLIEKIKYSKLPIYSIDELFELSNDSVDASNMIETTNQIIGYVQYRDGSIIDNLYKYK